MNDPEMPVPLPGDASGRPHPRRIALATTEPFLIALGGLAFAATLIRQHPAMFWGDTYARVLNREHILVDRWLPFIQLVIYGVGRLTPSIEALRLVDATIAALAIVSAARFGARLFTYSTGMIFATLLATNAMFVGLSLGPYQEVPFAGFIFAGLSLDAQRDSRRCRWLAAAAFNLACLTRYEGWILVAVLAVEALVREADRSGVTKGLRAGITLAVRYGAAALGWLLTLRLLRETGRLLQDTPTGPVALKQRASEYVYRLGWEIGSCPPRHGGGVGRWAIVVVLGLLAVIGVSAALRRRETRRSHAIIFSFLALAITFVLLANPYTPGNLRQTFLPVVFGLLYAAYGLDVVVRSAIQHVPFGPPHVTRPASTAVVAGIIAILAARNTSRFVTAASDEVDFRVPSAVGRWFAQIPVEERKQLRISSLLDNADNLVVALYAQVPISSVAALAARLPAGTTHVLYIPRSGKALSGDAEALERHLEGGSIGANATWIESAVVWTLQTPWRL